ncbi:MAG: ATPase [Candidatus Viridilinea halotolerans]|uniref:ATPase n=1 Tax=Candidatus Viridilinea halotolerans TaxID=2491704 RepID=A0A426TQL3_9CHLR|nr:MAG: ATPase [Candidatus Viridilinea halotolerans]
MLTRLKVKGFKNLLDVDVRLGAFTCIAGANGVGKSNLFDAIRFLSALADQSLVDAALSVRDEGNRTGDVRSLFYRSGDIAVNEMSFYVEMIIPATGIDDLGQHAEASISFVRYGLTLSYRQDELLRSPGVLELKREELHHINIGDAREHLSFPHSVAWRNSAIKGRRTSPFISTETVEGNLLIKVHQEGKSGRPRQLLASNLPRTALSATNAAENPTALLVRREMQSWRLLMLEPAAMRRPDNFTAPTSLGSDGSHLAAALTHLARLNEQGHDDRDAAAAQVYGQVADRVSRLIEDVRRVWIDRDERRELLTLFVAGADGTSYPARALSDGTLRFLALAVLELDPQMQGVICLEEPENGIHPERIPAMLQLLQDIAVDLKVPVGSDNPLRQVIVNTHAPAVVQQLPDDSLLVAERRESIYGNKPVQTVRFGCLPDTWRTALPDTLTVARGALLAYLNPVAPLEEPLSPKRSERPRRVVDRGDLQPYLPLLDQSS